MLPEFQKFLLDRKLAPEKHISFIAYWVSKFLHFAGKKESDPAQYNKTVVMEFIEQLRADARTTEWQARQAADAMRLYYFHYLGQKSGSLRADAPVRDITAALAETKRMIRLKHYAYSTERTYLQWIERFFSYALDSGKNKTLADLDAHDFKNFLSHLALKKRVSSSTQNQAFNALLFLFNSVLGKETPGLGDSVRAKRGQKLPVVFSVSEIKTLKKVRQP